MTQNTSLRNRIAEMSVGQVLQIPLGAYKSNTVYNYASFIGRELDRTYRTRYRKADRLIEVTRTA